jgi:PBP1b-binding outer membrane lipoprotein LpoB
MVKERIWLVVSALLLVGCGAEVAGTAATVGKLQATQAEQAKEQQRQIEKQLGEALRATEARASEAQKE